MGGRSGVKGRPIEPNKTGSEWILKVDKDTGITQKLRKKVKFKKKK